MSSGQTALDLAKDEQMRQVLSVQPIRRLLKSATTFEGMLLKRSRFLGWKPLWVSERLPSIKILEQQYCCVFH